MRRWVRKWATITWCMLRFKHGVELREFNFRLFCKNCGHRI